MKDWQEQFELDWNDIRYSVLEHNPDNPSETRQTWWAGSDAKSRLISLINGLLYQQKQEILEKLKAKSWPVNGHVVVCVDDIEELKDSQ